MSESRIAFSSRPVRITLAGWVIGSTFVFGTFVSAAPADDDAGTKDGAVESLIDEGAETLDSLRRTIDRMRDAGRRIGDDGDTGKATRDLQRRAVADLDRLLELAKSRSRSTQRTLQPRSPEPGQPEERPGDADPRPMPGMEDNPAEDDPSGAKPMPGDPNGGADDPDASDSTDRTDRAADREARMAEHRRLVKDVWGHLPPSMREQLLNPHSDEPLPKYEDLVNAYFKALAERSRRDR